MLPVSRVVSSKISYIMERSSSSNDEVDALFESDYSDAVRLTTNWLKEIGASAWPKAEAIQKRAKILSRHGCNVKNSKISWKRRLAVIRNVTLF